MVKKRLATLECNRTRVFSVKHCGSNGHLGGFVPLVSALCLVFALLTATSAVAQTPAREESGAQSHQDLHARLAAVPPKIDGVLDDELWSGEPLPLDKWMSYNPLRGEPEQQRTSVWIGYDSQAIYFAFRCYDDEPDKIRSTISRQRVE